MADVVTATKPITRNKLAQWLPNHEAVKALENLTADVPMLGDASNGLQAQVDESAQRISTLEGRISALELEADALSANVALLNSQVAALQAAVIDAGVVVTQYNALRSQLGTFTKFVADFSNRPKP